MSLNQVMPPQARVGFWKNPTTVCLTVLTLVFLCGAVVGALAMNLGHQALHRTAFWTDSGRTLALENLKKQLDLTPVQTAQMEGILDDFSKYYKTVLSDGKTRIMQILTDQQKQKFQRLLLENQQR